MDACGSGQSNYLYYLFNFSGAKTKYIDFWLVSCTWFFVILPRKKQTEVI